MSFLFHTEHSQWFVMVQIVGSVIKFSSVQLSHSVVSNSLWPHGLQHARPPCPSPTPEVYSNSCPLSHWCHPTTSSSVVPFSRLQSFSASGSFLMSQFFASGGQSIGLWASASVLPTNTFIKLLGFKSQLCQFLLNIGWVAKRLYTSVSSPVNQK